MITKSLFFEAGATVTIEIGGPENAYKTQIEEVTEETIVVQPLMRGTQMLKLTTGQKVTLIAEKRMNPYFFETTVASASHVEGEVISIQRPPDRSGAQKRSFVRIDVVIPQTQVWVEKDGKYGPTVQGTILNISAGGARLMTKEPLPSETDVLLKFMLPQKFGQIMTTGQTIGSWEVVGEGGKSYRTTLKFVDLKDKDRDVIIKFVFQRERDLRQRGVL